MTVQRNDQCQISEPLIRMMVMITLIFEKLTPNA